MRAAVADERLQPALDLIDRLPWKPRPTGEDYRMHLLRVAHRVGVEFALGDPDLVLAALLHDVLEDQRPALGSDPELLLAHQFGERVVELVQALTNPRDGDYAAHVLAMLPGPAGPIKLADFLDNALRLHELEESRRTRLSLKYAPVAAGMVRWLQALPSTHPLAARSAGLCQQIGAHYDCVNRSS